MKEQDVKVGSIWKSKKTSALNLILSINKEGRIGGFNLTRSRLWDDDDYKKDELLTKVEFVAPSFEAWQAQQKQLDKKADIMDAYSYSINERSGFAIQTMLNQPRVKMSLEEARTLYPSRETECKCDSYHLTVFGHQQGCGWKKGN